MSNYRKHIDDFFREKLGNYKETPPPEVWAELEGRLDGLTPVAPASPYRWVRHAAIISLLVVLGVSVGKKFAGTNIYKSSEPVAGTEVTPGNVAPANTSGLPTPSATAPGSTTTTPQGSSDNSGNQGNNRPAAASFSATGTIPNRSLPAVARSHQRIASRISTHPAAFRHAATGVWTGEKPNTEKPSGSSPVASDDNFPNPEARPGKPLSGSDEQPNLPGTLSKEEPKVSGKSGSQKPGPIGPGTRPPAKAFSRFEAGIKGGYEAGSNGGAIVKAVVAPYLQLNLSRKFALMTQPAFKFASMSTHFMNNGNSYYAVNNDGVAENTSTPLYITVGSNQVIYAYANQYRYTQSHDSIVKSNKYGGTYTELELPLLVKYRLSKKVSAYGGLNLVYSKTPAVSENTFAQNISVTVTARDTTATMPSGGRDLGINYNGTPISDYKNPYATQSKSELNIGFMAGITLECNKRFMLDALMQQTPVGTGKSSSIGSTQNVTFFRLSVGYKLTK